MNVTALMDETTRIIAEQYFPDLIVPDNFATDTQISNRYADARNLCYDALRSVVTSWTSLATAIDEAKVYRTNGYAGRFTPLPTAEQKHYEITPDDGYPVRIHTDKAYRDRWLFYLQEGYLISKPFPRQGMGSDEYDAQDIPDDPRDLEPFVVVQLSSDVTLRL